MKIAIIGAGFSGLALAYRLTRHASFSVSLFDHKEIGENTSGLAAGLLHPYRSSSFEYNWNATICMAHTLDLLEASSRELEMPCYAKTGILRPLTDQKMWNCTFSDATIEAWSSEKTATIPHLEPIYAIFLHQGYTVDCALYLQGLFSSCKKQGLQFEKQKIATFQELKSFDIIVATVGAYTATLPETRHLPIVPIKGQLITLQAREKTETLPFPVFAKSYLIEKDNTYILGSTFERNYTSTTVDVSFAEQELRKKTHAFSPYYASLPLLTCKAGLRASTKNHRPIIEQLSETSFCLTGLGSRGLFYHGFFSKQLEEHITSLV